MFENKGFTNGKILSLTPREALEVCQIGVCLVDVREEFMIGYKKFDVPSVCYFPLSELKNDIHALPVDQYLIFADASGLHSKEAILLLLEAGYTKIANLAGGLVEWERDGLPLNLDDTEKLTGSCMCQLKRRSK
ncbi:MAG: rhodanese-like domain-containing protein [Bacteroidetes bacterium HGW-Bacteroidetes-21]|jgi:rhodanese-related sulfurtransferase|nr:MAG: rhodanese-like domain-containing protein [Bacteroidetes bacterium HGW-Bacteroidetes-21]